MDRLSAARGDQGAGVNADERNELVSLRRQHRVLRMDRDVNSLERGLAREKSLLSPNGSTLGPPSQVSVALSRRLSEPSERH